MVRLFCDLGSLARTNLINIFGSLSLFSQTSQISNESDRGSTIVEKKGLPRIFKQVQKVDQFDSQVTTISLLTQRVSLP